MLSNSGVLGLLKLMGERFDSKLVGTFVQLEDGVDSTLDILGVLEVHSRLAVGLGMGAGVHIFGVGLEDVADLSGDVLMVSGKSKMGLGITMMVDETMLNHDSVQFADGTLRFSGSMSDDRVELVDKSVVLNQRVHPVLLHLHMTI
jgi:hypothetical protein